METVQIENLKEIRKAKEKIEKEKDIKIKINSSKKTAEINGSALDEYEVQNILEAISFGFSAQKAIALLNEDIEFRKINIKDFTRRKNLRDVRSRIIGKKGKIKHTIEELSGCSIILKDNALGILGDIEFIDTVITALGNIAKGSKASNVYSYLERSNRRRRKLQEY